QVVPSLDQNVELQPTLTDSPDLSGPDTTAEVPDPALDPQANGNGKTSSSSGNGGGTSGSRSGGATQGGPGALAATTYVFPTIAQMNRYWLLNTVGPRPLLGAAFTGGWETWRNTPHEWEPNGRGWSKRFGSTLLDNGINQSTLILWSRAVGQDPRYSHCDCTGVKARTGHAIKMAFMSRNRSGGFTFSPAKVISPFAGPMVTRNTIYPDRFGVGDAFAGGAYYFAGGVGWNLVREFILKGR